MGPFSVLSVLVRFLVQKETTFDKYFPWESGAWPQKARRSWLRACDQQCSCNLDCLMIDAKLSPPACSHAADVVFDASLLLN